MIHLSRRCNPSPRLLLVIGLALLTLYGISTTTHVQIQDGSVAVRLREHLSLNPLTAPAEVAAPKPPAEEKKKTDVYKFNADKDLMIKSRSNPSGDANRIDSRGIDAKLFNPAILQLPAGSAHDFLIVARIGHIDEQIGGRNYRRGREVVFFANLEHDDAGAPVIRRSGDWHRTILEGEGYSGPEHHCESEDVIDKYIGPEDAKLYWTHAGAPILMFTQQVPYEGECQGMFMIDARAAIPELVDAFGSAAGSLPAVEVSKPRQLRRPRQAVTETSWSYRFEREKNWVPFQHPPLVDDDEPGNVGSGSGAADPDELFFHVQPEAPRIYRFVRGQKYVAAVAEPATPQTCLKDTVAEGLHQGTPLLSVTLCRRGECEPDRHNTILVGLVQKRRLQPYLWYDSRVVTWNATAPYAFRSISKRVLWQGTREGQYNWHCGLVYRWNSTAGPANRSHGFLDDEMWVTYGVTDREAGWVDVLPEDLLREHTFCK